MYLKLKEENLVSRMLFFPKVTYLKYLIMHLNQHTVLNMMMVCLAHDRKSLGSARQEALPVMISKNFAKGRSRALPEISFICTQQFILTFCRPSCLIQRPVMKGQNNFQSDIVYHNEDQEIALIACL